jgi:hypothetical protein
MMSKPNAARAGFAPSLASEEFPGLEKRPGNQRKIACVINQFIHNLALPSPAAA